jgi:hypothetical protein
MLRLGIRLARETKQLARGIQIYEELVDRQHAVDRPALTTLALGASDELSTSPDGEARMIGCSAALDLEPTHAACGKAMASSGADADESAWRLYSLANTGHRPRTDDMNIAEATMSVATRLRVAKAMTHLPAAERVRLVRGVLTDPNLSRRYQALLILGEIRGVEARDALLYELAGNPPNPLKAAILLGLAQHGHEASLVELKAIRSGLGEYEQSRAAVALSRTGDAQGRALLQQALTSASDISRLDAAEAIAEFDKAAAVKAVLDSLTTGSPAIRQRALKLAGALGLGTEKAVYRALTDLSPLVRAETVAAIQETFFLQDGRDKARHP